MTARIIFRWFIEFTFDFSVALIRYAKRKVRRLFFLLLFLPAVGGTEEMDIIYFLESLGYSPVVDSTASITYLSPRIAPKNGEILEWACDHEWVKSKLSLVETVSNSYAVAYPVTNLSDGTTTYWHDWIPGQQLLTGVEICQHCGLIRINPKELEKMKESGEAK